MTGLDPKSLLAFGIVIKDQERTMNTINVMTLDTDITILVCRVLYLWKEMEY